MKVKQEVVEETATATATATSTASTSTSAAGIGTLMDNCEYMVAEKHNSAWAQCELCQRWRRLQPGIGSSDSSSRTRMRTRRGRRKRKRERRSSGGSSSSKQWYPSHRSCGSGGDGGE